MNDITSAMITRPHVIHTMPNNLECIARGTRSPNLKKTNKKALKGLFVHKVCLFSATPRANVATMRVTFSLDFTTKGDTQFTLLTCQVSSDVCNYVTLKIIVAKESKPPLYRTLALT